MVDCSHGNSAKNYERQPAVMADVLQQRLAGRENLIGAMVESNLAAGQQPFPVPRAQLRPGVSITDACIDWPATERMVRQAHALLPEALAAV
jgi:3-deoxy-7-phosphoheptulonate synthase